MAQRTKLRGGNGSRLLGGLVVSAGALVVLACGARSELPAPEEAGGVGGAGCPAPSMVVTATIGGGVHHQFLECFTWPEDQPCPGPDEARTHAQPRCVSIDSVDCGPERRGAACCYLITEGCAET